MAEYGKCRGRAVVVALLTFVALVATGTGTAMAASTNSSVEPPGGCDWVDAKARVIECTNVTPDGTSAALWLAKQKSFVFTTGGQVLDSWIKELPDGHHYEAYIKAQLAGNAAM